MSGGRVALIHHSFLFGGKEKESNEY